MRAARKLTGCASIKEGPRAIKEGGTVGEGNRRSTNSWGGSERAKERERGRNPIEGLFLALGNAAVAAPAAGLVEMSVLMCLGAVLICREHTPVCPVFIKEI